MIKGNGLPHRVLIVTGFSPITPASMDQMGMTFESFPVLLSMLGKKTFRFSIPSIGPAVLAAYLQQHQIEVDVKDFFFDEINFTNYDIIGVSSTFLSDQDVNNIVELARRINPSSGIILGGPISWSIPPGQLISQIPDVDYIVVKSGEQSFLELIEAIRQDRDPISVKSLVYKSKEGNLVETPIRSHTDFVDFSRPAWESMGIPSPNRIPVLPIETSRGCPNNCAYCSEVTYWGKPVRYRPIDAVVKELEYNVTRYGISTFRFTDSCFSAPPERCSQLCDQIFKNCTKNGMPVKWSAYARIDNLNKELLETMQRSGCVALDLGLESGSETVLRKMGRGYTPQAASEITKIARELGIFTNFNVIVGFPGETRETIAATTETINTAKPDTISCFLFHLPPNTRVFSALDLFKIEGFGHNWKHDTMTSQEANEAMFHMIKQIKYSTHFPGGEYFACFLASLGYSITDIRYFFQTAGNLHGNIDGNSSLSLFKEMLNRLSTYV